MATASDYEFMTSEASVKMTDAELAGLAGVNVSVVRGWATWARGRRLPFPVSRAALLESVNAYTRTAQPSDQHGNS